MVISLNPEGWSHRRLCDGSRLPALASSLRAAESEIAAGRIALFTPRFRGCCLCCSHTVSRVPIWTVDPLTRASLAFTRHPCSSQPGLSSDGQNHQRPFPCFLNTYTSCKCALRAAQPAIVSIAGAIIPRQPGFSTPNRLREHPFWRSFQSHPIGST